MCVCVCVTVSVWFSLEDSKIDDAEQLGGDAYLQIGVSTPECADCAMFCTHVRACVWCVCVWCVRALFCARVCVRVFAACVYVWVWVCACNRVFGVRACVRVHACLCCVCVRLCVFVFCSVCGFFYWCVCIHLHWFCLVSPVPQWRWQDWEHARPQSRPF